MADHGVHGMETLSLLFCFLHAFEHIAHCCLFTMSYPVSRVNRFAFNPLALAALVSVLRGLQQISQKSSLSLLDVATDSVTSEDESSDSLADEDVEVADEDAEATDSARGDEGATDSVTCEDESADALADEDGASDSATGDEAKQDIA